MKETKYKLLVCAGSFDQFHKGHKDFLQYALSLSEKVLLGITSDAYIANIKQVDDVQSFAKRKQQVLVYLDAIQALERVEIIPIDNGNIPDEWSDLPIEAILVTADSLAGALTINKEREASAKQPLQVVEFPLTLAEDKKSISATRIRNGSISSDGVVFVKPEWFTKTLLLPKSLRSRLQKPFGKMIDAKTADFSDIVWQKTISVGDVTTLLLHERGVAPVLSIVDFVVERKRAFHVLSDLGFLGKERVSEVKNPAGQITPELFQSVKHFFADEKSAIETVIQVNGEEDLAVLPVILLAPLGWHVYYGQPSVGTVQVAVTEERKTETFALLQKFTIR